MTTLGDPRPGSPPPEDEFGDGIVVRPGRAEDVDGLAELYGFVFREGTDAPRNAPAEANAHDLACAAHPLGGAERFVVAEDRRRGGIVGGCCLTDQPWDLDGVALRAGRIEIVALLPEYRGRGLMGAMMRRLHTLSAELGHLLQVITGEPRLYRNYGYGYAVDLGGGLELDRRALPPATGGYVTRPAGIDDAALVSTLYERERLRFSLTADIGVLYWGWVLDGQDPASLKSWDTRIAVDGEGTARGALFTARRAVDSPDLTVLGVFAEDRVGARELLLDALSPANPHTGSQIDGRVLIGLPRGHPYRDAFAGLPALERAPSAWYVRIPDVPAYLLRLGPALERRLACSALAGWSGSLRISTFSGGFRLRFGDGRLVEAADWRPAPALYRPDQDAALPPEEVPALLLGHRSLDQIKEAWPETGCTEAAATLLNALFPPRPNWVLPLD